jgi:hypothetical protein
MWLFILEAGSAMFLLVFIVWWTMFSGQKPTPPGTANVKNTKNIQNSTNPDVAQDASLTLPDASNDDRK